MQKLDANVMPDGLPAQPQIANGIILDMSCFDFLESMQAERVETAVPWVHHLSLALFHLFGEERDLLIHTYS